MPQINLNPAEARQICDNAFANVIGQTLAVDQIKTNLIAASQDQYLKPMAFIGGPGSGKSYLMRAMKDAIRGVLGRKRVCFETGKELGSRVTLTEEYLIPHIHEQFAVIMVDEVHEGGKDALNILRTCLQPDSKRESTTFRPYKDYEFTYNPLQHSIIVGTNKVDKLDPAFLSRFQRVDLMDYTDEEMEAILHRNLSQHGIQFNENTLRIIAECNRGTARDVQHWEDAIRQQLAIAQKNSVNRDDVREIIRRRQTFPLGVTELELRTLLILEREGHCQLKRLAALNGIASKEQNANEVYLMRRNLLEIDGTRHILPDGVEYLKDLRKHRFIPALKMKND